jgi:putative aldouronate transport system substrate-binding protein
MFGAPNGWSLVGGKLTKDLETPQYKEAAGYVRDLVASQLFHPDALTIPDPNTARGDFLAGKISLIVELFGVGWQDAWTRGLKQNPVFIPAPVLPFAAHDGGKAQHYLSAGVNGLTMFKKGSAERIQELLRIANYCASPFGSAEDLLLTTGVQGPDYTLDADGRPVPTPASNTDANSVPWKYIVQHPQVAWLTGVPDYAKAATDFEKLAIPLGVQDPTYGFFSNLNDSKGGVLSQAFIDGLTDILASRRPLADYDQIVKDWQNNGGNQIRSEFEAAVAAGQ